MDAHWGGSRVQRGEYYLPDDVAAEIAANRATRARILERADLDRLREDVPEPHSSSVVEGIDDAVEHAATVVAPPKRTLASLFGLPAGASMARCVGEVTRILSDSLRSRLESVADHGPIANEWRDWWQRLTRNLDEAGHEVLNACLDAVEEDCVESVARLRARKEARAEALRAYQVAALAALRARTPQEHDTEDDDIEVEEQERSVWWGHGYADAQHVEEARRLWAKLVAWGVEPFVEGEGGDWVSTSRTVRELLFRLDEIQLDGPEEKPAVEAVQLMAWITRARAKRAAAADAAVSRKRETKADAKQRLRLIWKSTVRGVLLREFDGRPVCKGFGREQHEVAAVGKLDLHRLPGGGGALRDRSTDAEWREAYMLAEKVDQHYALLCRKCHRAAEPAAQARRDGSG